MNKYFCLKCKRFHYRGKIYENHLKFKEKIKQKNNPINNKKNFIPSNKILEFDVDELRPIAQRQIQRWVMKMNQSKRFMLYKREINKIILHEKKLLR